MTTLHYTPFKDVGAGLAMNMWIGYAGRLEMPGCRQGILTVLTAGLCRVKLSRHQRVAATSSIQVIKNYIWLIR